MRCWGPACVLKGTWVFLFWWVVCTMAQWRLLWTRLHFWFLSLRFSLGHPVGAFLELSYWSPWLAAQDPSPHTHSTESAGQVNFSKPLSSPLSFLQSPQHCPGASLPCVSTAKPGFEFPAVCLCVGLLVRGQRGGIKVMGTGPVLVGLAAWVLWCPDLE